MLNRNLPRYQIIAHLSIKLYEKNLLWEEYNKESIKVHTNSDSNFFFLDKQVTSHIIIFTPTLGKWTSFVSLCKKWSFQDTIAISLCCLYPLPRWIYFNKTYIDTPSSYIKMFVIQIYISSKALCWIFFSLLSETKMIISDTNTLS